jgi:tRNA 2-thiouridine synthesizing protein A
MIEFDVEVDARGLNCPLPLLRLKKAMTAMEHGKIIKIVTTDPAAHLDFGVYVDQAGHVLIDIYKETGQQVFYIQKNPATSS